MKNFNRQPSSRINPDVYLSNKEYFDEGLILSLENLVHKVDDLTDRVDLFSLRCEKDKNTIRGLRINDRDLRAQVYNLKSNGKKTNKTAEDLEKEIQKVYTILDEEIDSRDQIIDEQNEVIKKQKEIIDEMQRKFKKMKFADTTNTNNPSSTYCFEDAVKNQSENEEQEEEPEVKKPHPVSMRQSSGRKKGGQPGHPVHRSRLSSTPSRIIDKKVLKAPTGAEAVTDNNGRVLYYATQEINASFITEVTETRYHISSKGSQLDEKEMKKYAINCVTYSARMKAQVLYLNNKGVIALDRLCTILNEMRNGKLEISQAAVTNWMEEFDHASEGYRKNILEEMLNAWSLHVDETGYKVNGKNSWVHVLCTEDLAYYVMTTKRKDVDSGPLKLLEDYEHVLIRNFLGLGIMKFQICH